eukprot:1529350-Rhodomonas_salina.1
MSCNGSGQWGGTKTTTPSSDTRAPKCGAITPSVTLSRKRTCTSSPSTCPGPTTLFRAGST